MVKFLKSEEADRRLLFCNNLRDIVRHGAVGAVELATKIGVSPSTIYSYMRGTTYPNDSRIQELADGLGITVDDLFDDTYAPWKFGEHIDGE